MFVVVFWGEIGRYYGRASVGVLGSESEYTSICTQTQVVVLEYSSLIMVQNVRESGPGELCCQWDTLQENGDSGKVVIPSTDFSCQLVSLIF